MNIETIVGLRNSSSAKVIDYDKVEIRPGFVNDTFFLVVSGEAPCLNMEVQLSPFIYITCPEYWGIEVIATLPSGACITAIKPFTLVIGLSGITGSQGIEVFGANKSEKLDVPGGCTP